MTEIIKQRIKVWEKEKEKIKHNKYDNHLIDLGGDVLICTVVIQELKEILKEKEEDE